jgi:hypothetical protein
MASRTKNCSERVRKGRLAKANEFLDAALLVEDEMADAAVNLYVLAGIAAADVICCATLGKHAIGENHAEAIQLLKQADRAVEQHLRNLLNLKSKVAYSETSATVTERKRVRRSAEALVEAARRTSTTSGRRTP